FLLQVKGHREEEKRSGYSEKHSKTRKIMSQNRKQVASEYFSKEVLLYCFIVIR
ncbi:unnamed protein product, partial [Bubo scandiacus]